MLHAQEDMLVRRRRAKAVFASYPGIVIFSVDVAVKRPQNESRHIDHGICVRSIFSSGSAMSYDRLETALFGASDSLFFIRGTWQRRNCVPFIDRYVHFHSSAAPSKLTSSG